MEGRSTVKLTIRGFFIFVAMCFASLETLKLCMYRWSNSAHEPLPLVPACIVQRFEIKGYAFKRNISENSLTSKSSISNDFITEEEAYRFDVCNDYKLATDASKSIVRVLGNNSIKLGQKIYVSITTVNGYGKCQSVGGDQLRIRMYNKELEAATAGYIVDHNNGTYTGVLEALWGGRASISVKLAYTRQTVRNLYHIRRKLGSTRKKQMNGVFTSGKFTELTLCHPQTIYLGNYSHICNFTYENSGMSWYCGKPVNIHLLCEDWVGINDNGVDSISKYPVNSDEDILYKREPQNVGNDREINISGSPGSIIDLTSNTPCHTYNRTELWTRRLTTGFLYNNTWSLRHCQGIKENSIIECMRDYKLWIFGDSTTRHWYEHILNRFQCTPTSEKWTVDKWHKRASCHSNSYNFSVAWLPHSQPFFVGNDVSRYTQFSIARRIDSINSKDIIIILVHIFMHIVNYPHEVFTDRIRKVRLSIDNILKRNPNVKILIKGAHTYQSSTPDQSRFNDYFGYLYRGILLNEFKGLYDKVIYLDNKDMTLALDVITSHPPPFVIAAMVKQMFSYVCYAAIESQN